MEVPELVNGAVRATCDRCGVTEERVVPLGASIARSYDKLLLWMRTDHSCREVPHAQD